MIVPILLIICGIISIVIGSRINSENLKFTLWLLGSIMDVFTFIFIITPLDAPDDKQAKIANEYLKLVTPSIENAEEIARAKRVVKYYNETVSHKQQYAKDIWVGWFFDDDIMDYKLLE